MNSMSKSLVALLAAVSFFADGAYATEPGNVNIVYPKGTVCDGFTQNPSGLTLPIALGQATVGGSHFFFMPILFERFVGSTFSSPITYQGTFNMANSTYSFLVPNSPGSTFERSGTFSGSIADNGFGGFNINLTLDCGVTLTGVTVYSGN